MCPWGAKSHDICRFLPILWFIHSTYVGNANCQVEFPNLDPLPNFCDMESWFVILNDSDVVIFVVLLSSLGI